MSAARGVGSGAHFCEVCSAQSERGGATRGAERATWEVRACLWVRIFACARFVEHIFVAREHVLFFLSPFFSLRAVVFALRAQWFLRCARGEVEAKARGVQNGRRAVRDG